MFDFGLVELAVIFLVMIIVLKPEDIPRTFRTLGEYYGWAQRFYHRMMNEFQAFSKREEGEQGDRPENSFFRGG